MRAIFKKLDRHIKLNTDEYWKLMQYIEDLRVKSPESYETVYNHYARILFADYSTYLPRFPKEIDDLISYLAYNPSAIPLLENNIIIPELIPPDLFPYVEYLLGNHSSLLSLKPVLSALQQQEQPVQLPAPRKAEPAIKYEDSNPYKEIGLKAHFDRLKRYPFITRLQTQRYLTRKTARERFEYISPDKLGGIFTNKRKVDLFFHLS
jgi:hypothetical protein